MDRSLLAEVTVAVYTTAATKEPTAIFKDRPYNRSGMEYYRYKEVLYPAYVNTRTGEIYILLDRPVPVKLGQYIL